jgi:hypothetical protein
VKKLEQAVPFDQTATQSDIEQTDHSPAIESEGPGFELFDAASSSGGPDHRSHRAPRDVVRCDALLGQRTKHTNVRPATRGAAPERDPERDSPAHCRGVGFDGSRYTHTGAVAIVHESVAIDDCALNPTIADHSFARPQCRAKSRSRRNWP